MRKASTGRMQDAIDSFKGKVIQRVQRVVVTALQVLTLAIVVVATIVLFQLFWKYLSTYGARLDTVGDLLPLMQRSFAGILVVVIGLELLETLQAYFTAHHVRIEVILIVAIIAVGRHVIQIDFEHTGGSQLIGIAALLVGLIAGYVAVRRNFAREAQARAGSQEGSSEPE